MRKAINTKLPSTIVTPTAPKLPHEQDESVGSTGGVPSPEMQLAYKDVKRGLQDTSRGTAADATYQKLKNDVP